jgi:addiction module HigA family antidote
LLFNQSTAVVSSREKSAKLVRSARVVLYRRKLIARMEAFNIRSEFMEPMGITQTELAEKTGLPRKHGNELCRNRRAVTADTALILSRVFGNSADFWLNTRRRTDLWEAVNTPQRFTRIQRAKPITNRTAAA